MTGSAKAKKPTRKPKRPRNPLVPVVRRKPVKVIDSAKRYRRKAKHPQRGLD